MKNVMIYSSFLLLSMIATLGLAKINSDHNYRQELKAAAEKKEYMEWREEQIELIIHPYVTNMMTNCYNQYGFGGHMPRSLNHCYEHPTSHDCNKETQRKMNETIEMFETANPIPQ